jgi:hypothetical protein
VEPSTGHSAKPPKAKSKVQTLGHELPRPLDLDGHSVKPPKAKPKVQTIGASHFIPCLKQPLQSNGRDIVNDQFFNEEKSTTSRP